MSLRKILLASCLVGLSFGLLAGCEKPGTEGPKQKMANPAVTSGKSAASTKSQPAAKAAPATSGTKPPASSAAK